MRARSRPRAPAGVLLRLLTQTTKARQSRPPSPRHPLPRDCSEGGGGKEEAGGGGPEGCPRGGGEGECWAALAPGGAPRGSRAHERPAPSTKSCFDASGRGCAAGAGTPVPPTPSSFPAASVDAVQGRVVRGPRAKHTLRNSCVAGLDVRCDFVPSSGTGRRPHSQSGVRTSGRCPAFAVATAA